MEQIGVLLVEAADGQMNWPTSESANISTVFASAPFTGSRNVSSATLRSITSGVRSRREGIVSSR